MSAGVKLGPAELALAAAMNHAQVPVVRRPRIAIIASGDELVLPGTNPGPNKIIACNSFAVAGLARDAGADVIDLGLFKDDLAELQLGIAQARAQKVDILVTLGGASVGDHDLLRPALAEQGMKLDFGVLRCDQENRSFMARSARCVYLACQAILLRPLSVPCLSRPAHSSPAGRSAGQRDPNGTSFYRYRFAGQ